MGEVLADACQCRLSRTTDWLSVAGKARISDDRERIKETFSSLTSSWFGDLGDGVHDGSANDPRVQLIVVSEPAWVSLATHFDVH